jgi:acyl dehydratase
MRPGSTIRAIIDVVEKRDVRQTDRGFLGLGFAIIDEGGTTIQQGSARLLMRRRPHEKARWGLVEGGRTDN